MQLGLHVCMFAHREIIEQMIPSHAHDRISKYHMHVRSQGRGRFTVSK